MKIKRFQFLNKPKISDFEILALLKSKVVPQFNISYDELVFYHGIKLIHDNKLWHYPKWKIYLNILIGEYQISESSIMNAVQQAIRTQKEENSRKIEEIIERYKM